MIQNILFDMGGVLVRWDPVGFIRDLGLDAEDSALLLREVFRSWRWIELDRGSMTDAEFLAAVYPRLPARLHGAAERLTCHWDEPPVSPPGMEALAEELAEKGYGLYLFTNASLRHREYWPRYRVSRLFENRIMRSADWQLLKPDPAFFEKGLSLFGLDRSTCLFIDDTPQNCAAAEHQGIRSLVFHGDAALLRRELEELQI
ncbi:MAG: HAD family hydrolase [bacterium]